MIPSVLAILSNFCAFAGGCIEEIMPDTIILPIYLLPIFVLSPLIAIAGGIIVHKLSGHFCGKQNHSFAILFAGIGTVTVGTILWYGAEIRNSESLHHFGNIFVSYWLQTQSKIPLDTIVLAGFFITLFAGIALISKYLEKRNPNRNRMLLNSICIWVAFLSVVSTAEGVPVSQNITVNDTFDRYRRQIPGNFRIPRPNSGFSLMKIISSGSGIFASALSYIGLAWVADWLFEDPETYETHWLVILITAPIIIILLLLYVHQTWKNKCGKRYRYSVSESPGHQIRRHRIRSREHQFESGEDNGYTEMRPIQGALSRSRLGQNETENQSPRVVPTFRR